MKKNLLKTLVLSATIMTGVLATAANVAHAATVFGVDTPTKNLAGQDQWNRGILSQAAGWYMPYSYYYNDDYSHNASVYTQSSGLKTTPVYSPGTSANINALSTPNLTNAYTRAGEQRWDSWGYTHDSGSGEY